jgi:isopenicillin-N N-acyltransferase-like protein
MITVAGSGRERGLDHGRDVAASIATTARALKAHLAGAGHSPDRLGRSLAASPLCRAAAEYTPDLWDEVTAIARGARVPLEDVLLLTFLDEVWAQTRGVGCSAMARVGRGGATEIGQTMDLPSWAQDRLLVMRVSPEHGPVALVMTYPGMIGLCGANLAGLGVAVNALSQFPLDVDGLAVAFVTRHLLTLHTLAAAREFLERVPHAVGQAYTIAAPDGIATFEAGPTGVRQVSAPDASSCVHTNHPLGTEAKAPASSVARLASLAASIDASTTLAEALSGEVVLDGERLGDPNLTFAAFRYIVGESEARFIDGAALRARDHEWTRVPFH